jgi:hypothetical protein
MHDVLKQRLLRRIESLPEGQVYQVLDFIEFLESKYARDLTVEASGLQRFAENQEDRLRRKAVSPATLREAFQLIAAADRVLSSVSSAGREILSDLSSLAEPPPQESQRRSRPLPEPVRDRPRSSAGETPPSAAREGPAGGDEE